MKKKNRKQRREMETFPLRCGRENGEYLELHRKGNVSISLLCFLFFFFILFSFFLFCFVEVIDFSCYVYFYNFIMKENRKGRNEEKGGAKRGKKNKKDEGGKIEKGCRDLPALLYLRSKWGVSFNS